MKKIFLISSLVCAFILSTSTLHAKTYKMLFWYPGEAGTSEDAAPVLDEFFGYVRAKSGLALEGKYINTPEGGLEYLKTAKPDIAIASWMALTQGAAVVPPYKTITSTLPLPDGTTKEQFVVVGLEGWTPAKGGTLLASLPAEPSFIKKYMMPAMADTTRVELTRSMLSRLKKIASKEDPAVAMLTPMEKYTIDNMKSEWAKNLKVLYKCNPIPSAPLIYFGNDDGFKDKLLQALKNMPNDEEGKAILDTLRLKGFQ